VELNRFLYAVLFLAYTGIGNSYDEADEKIQERYQ